VRIRKVVRKNMQSNVDLRDSLEREKACKREIYLRSDSFRRQNVQRLAEIPQSGSSTVGFSFPFSGNPIPGLA
jgi:hypothetical protein